MKEEKINISLDEINLTLTDLALAEIELMQKKHIIPLLALVIAQGTEEGVFDTGSTHKIATQSSAEFIQTIMNTTLDTFILTLMDTERSENAFELVKLKFSTAQRSIERILNAPEGSLKVVDYQKLEEWFA